MARHVTVSAPEAGLTCRGSDRCVRPASEAGPLISRIPGGFAVLLVFLHWALAGWLSDLPRRLLF